MYRRIGAWAQDYRWSLIFSGLLLAGLLVFVGLGDASQKGPWVWRLTGRAYDTLQILGLGSGALRGVDSWSLGLARWLIAAVAAFTLWNAWAVIFREQRELLQLRRVAGHTVICGLGEKGRILAAELSDAGHRVVTVEARRPTGDVANETAAGVMTVYGDATSRPLLEKVGVARARYLIAVCGSDVANGAIAAAARDLVRGRTSVLTCFMHLGDLDLFRAMREQEFSSEPAHGFRLQCFNVFESGARAMVTTYPPPLPLDGVATRAPHLVVIGLERFGESLVVHLARLWHWERTDRGERMRITVVDEQASSRLEGLRLRYPRLVESCELRAVQSNPTSPDFEEAKFLRDDDGRVTVSRIYVCVEDDAIALSCALNLRWRLVPRAVPIIVRMTREGGIAALLPSDVRKDLPQIHLFGALSRTCTVDLLRRGTTELVAQAFHRHYVREQERQGRSPDTKPSMVGWDELPEALKESNRAQADHIGTKLRAIGCSLAPLGDWDAPAIEFTPDEVDLLAAAEHSRWEAMKHPAEPSRSSAAWDELPEDVQALNRAAVQALPRILAHAGFRIVRGESTTA